MLSFLHTGCGDEHERVKEPLEQALLTGVFRCFAAFMSYCFAAVDHI